MPFHACESGLCFAFPISLVSVSATEKGVHGCLTVRGCRQFMKELGCRFSGSLALAVVQIKICIKIAFGTPCPSAGVKSSRDDIPVPFTPTHYMRAGLISLRFRVFKRVYNYLLSVPTTDPSVQLNRNLFYYHLLDPPTFLQIKVVQIAQLRLPCTTYRVLITLCFDAPERQLQCAVSMCFCSVSSGCGR